MNTITVDQLAHLDDAVVIDVREADEYATGHVPGAVNLPLSTLQENLQSVPRDTPVHVICQAGGRSAKATQLFTDLGIDATNVTGGTQAWIDGQLPLERP